MLLYYVQHTSSLAFSWELERTKTKKRKKRACFLFPLPFLPFERGRGLHQFFWVYGVVFISSPNLNGIFNAVLGLFFL